MTLKDVLGIIRQRWLTVLVTALLITGAAGVYAALTEQSYESTTILRFSSAASQSLEGGEAGYPGMDLDLDTFFVTSEEVLEQASAASGETVETLRNGTVATLMEGTRALRLAVTSEAPTPEASQQKADAVAQAYVAHLEEQMNEHHGQLEEELEGAQSDRDEALEAATDDSEDLFAQQQLTQALTEVVSIESQTTFLEQAGPPAVLMEDAAPGRPLGTEPYLLLIIGAVCGLIAGAGAALLREQFDDRLRSSQAMESQTGKPLLAEVPAIRRRRGEATLPLADPTPSPFNESIRSLRTSLQVAYPQRRPAIVITSPSPGDGKSFLIANLAVSIARSGRRVLLVSGDLRRPGLASFFGAEPESPGFAEALENDDASEQIEQRLIPTEFENLRLLASGAPRRQPGDLLAGESMPSIMERLRGLADVVLIDAPPGLEIADAALLGQQADGVVVVASLRTTAKRDLTAMLHSLELSSVPVVGIVANRSRRKAHRSYTSYYQPAPTPSPTPAPAPAPTPA